MWTAAAWDATGRPVLAHSAYSLVYSLDSMSAGPRKPCLPAADAVAAGNLIVACPLQLLFFLFLPR